MAAELAEYADGHGIGIDLGTTYSCVGIWTNNRVEIVANDMGNRTTPSLVAFNEMARLVGEGAKTQASTNIENSIFDVKRLIGRKMTDPLVVKDQKFWPFKIVSSGKDAKPRIQVTFKGEKRLFYPEEISAMVLVKMRDIAEAFIGDEVTRAVITVPAYFNDSQRQATEDAGTIAGLEVLRILNEPTAAALAYGLDKKSRRVKGSSQRVLIFDLGGGTFDVSLLTIEDGIFEVLATSGDTHLGGGDFDNVIVTNFIDEFKRKHNKNLLGNARAICRLRSAAERAKRTLSMSLQAQIEIDSLSEGIDFGAVITRAKFENLNQHLFQRCMGPVQVVLDDAGLRKKEIDHVVLVGGSTRIPKIRSLITNFFGIEPCQTVNPDEAVAYGATVQAAVLVSRNISYGKAAIPRTVTVAEQVSVENFGGKAVIPHASSRQIPLKLQNVLLLDVAPLTLGVEIKGGIMSPLIPRNTTVPTKRTMQFSTASNNQTSVLVQVYEGENRKTKQNNRLGKFVLAGIPPMKRGKPDISVIFQIDENGILKVTAVEMSTGKEKNITVRNNKGLLTDEEIRQMTEDSERLQFEDHRNQARDEARTRLEDYVYSAKKALATPATLETKFPPDKREFVDTRLENTLLWLEDNEYGEKKMYIVHYKELMNQIEPIFKTCIGKTVSPDYKNGKDERSSASDCLIS